MINGHLTGMMVNFHNISISHTFGRPQMNITTRTRNLCFHCGRRFNPHHGVPAKDWLVVIHWGFRLDWKTPFVLLRPADSWDATQLVLHRHAIKKALQKLVGFFVHPFMRRRECMSIFHHTYMHTERLPECGMCKTSCLQLLSFCPLKASREQGLDNDAIAEGLHDLSQMPSKQDQPSDRMQHWLWFRPSKSNSIKFLQIWRNINRPHLPTKDPHPVSCRLNPKRKPGSRLVTTLFMGPVPLINGSNHSYVKTTYYVELSSK